MSIIIRFIIIFFCAYAGLLFAEGQFSDLPAESYDLAQRDSSKN
jgi:hypothetical protein